LRLWNSRGIGVIILFESGVRYSNQVGGYGCLHPEVEGVFVPLVDETVDQERDLKAHFTGPKWQGWCNDGIDAETADFIDAVLERSPYTEKIKVDRDRLVDSYEAWVYVKLPSTEGDSEYTVIHGFAGRSGVLTWENSD